MALTIRDTALDRELFDIWVEGYCTARKFGELEVVAGGLWLEVAKPQQAGRYFVSCYDPTVLSTIIEGIIEPAVYVEFPGTKVQALQHMPKGWHVRDDSHLMSVCLSALIKAEQNDLVGCEYAINRSNGVTKIEARTTSGRLAAAGCFSIVGEWAVFDQILVEPEYRRNGLGSSLVRQLAIEAVYAGSVYAVLVATDEGRTLYNRLGWTCVSTIISIISS